MSNSNPTTNFSIDTMTDFSNIDSMDAGTYAERMQWAYSKVLDAAGRNMADPLIGNMKYFNVWGHKPSLDPVRAGKTYVFMTRPDLNFGYLPNYLTVPYFKMLAQTEIGRILMQYLMFPGLTGDVPEIPNFGNADGIRSNLIDDAVSTSPFIPLVTNLCTQTNGGKDLVLDVHETDADFNGNKNQYAAGMDDIFTIGEVTAEYEDALYSPALFLNYIWALYAHCVSRGICVSKRTYSVNKIIDYFASIYVFVTDMDGQTIIRWAKYSGCFPRSVPMGLIQHSTDLNIEMLRHFSINYAYNAYEPMTPEVITDFNALCTPYINTLLTGASGSGTNAMLSLLQPGIDGVPVKAVESPFAAVDDSRLDRMRTWYGGHPYIYGNKLVFLRPNDVSQIPTG